MNKETDWRFQMNSNKFQDEFDQVIGRLDRVLSKLVGWGKNYKEDMENEEDPDYEHQIDEANAQTLKHHAEDMIAAGQKILKDLGKDVQGTPRP